MAKRATLTGKQQAFVRRHADLLPNDVQVRERNLKDYILDPRNPNRGTERGAHMIGTSVEQFGPMRSGVADKDDVIRAGNHTAEELAAAGIERVIEVEHDGKVWVVVKRRDITPEQGKAYAVADNRSTEVGLSWEPDVLKEFQDEGIDLSQFWHEDELAALLAGVDGGTPPGDPGAQIDRAGELQEKWQVKPGDLWQIGKHRLLCGDSTRAEDVARVMGDERAALMVTDPPYAVDYVGKARDMNARGYGHSRATLSAAIEGDEINDEDATTLWRGAFVAAFDCALIDNAALYIWHAQGRAMLTLYNLLLSLDVLHHQTIIWVKNNFVIGRCDYQWIHEPCFYGWRKGHRPPFYGERNQTTVWEVSRDVTEPVHPTQKPVEIMRRPIENHSKTGEALYDPFLGSGTTLVACEQMGRIGHGIEIEPKYCAVTLERLAAMGLEARRL